MNDFTDFAVDRIMVIAAPNGARRSKLDHPAIPLTPGELAEDAGQLRQAGVAVLHLHVRDEAGRHTLDVSRYREAIAAIRDEVGDDLIVQVTTEAVGMYDAEQQMQLVRALMPEAVSLALRELCPDHASESRAAEFFGWLGKHGVWPQYILYSADDVEKFDDMRRRGVFADSAPFVLFVLGRYAGGSEGSPSDLDALMSAADCSAFPWAVCCFGSQELEVMRSAYALGGHVRLGFENNLAMADGQVAADNVALIRQFTAAVSGGARRPADPAEVRAAFLSR